MKLSEQELVEVIGGVNISGSFINSLVRGINAFLDLGRSFGTAIKRIFARSACPL